MELTRKDLIVEGAIIAGVVRKGTSDGREFEVTNPANCQVLARLPDCGAAEAREAADAAVRAFPEWRERTAKDRCAVMKAWHALLLKNSEDLSRLISLEEGKPIAESRAEVAYGASYVEWFAEEAKRSYGDVVPEPMKGRKLIVVREPVGVVAAITPWNFPIAMLARKMAPALAAGCTMVAKPSEDAPLSSLAMTLLAEEAGVPAGALNILTSSRHRAGEVGDAWLADWRIRKISFTGSTAVGKHLMRGSADTLKRLSMELGGNAPFIVFDDADLDAAVTGVMASKFRNSGQTCICANRIYVQEAVYDAFATKLAETVAKLRVGPAEEDGTQQGPLINPRALAKVEEHLRDAVAKGGKVLTGGRRHPLGGTFFEPTVLTDCSADMRLAGEETFGPIAPLFRFRDEAEVVRLANATPFGLAAYFYARDLGRVWRVAGALESGIVGINEGIISSEAAPFGGVKESGFGTEGARRGLEEYQSLKYLCMGGLTK